MEHDVCFFVAGNDTALADGFFFVLVELVTLSLVMSPTRTVRGMMRQSKVRQSCQTLLLAPLLEIHFPELAYHDRVWQHCRTWSADIAITRNRV